MPEVGTPDDVAHVIQVALTPAFLLTGVSGLLNVFNARLTRIEAALSLQPSCCATVRINLSGRASRPNSRNWPDVFLCLS